MLCISWPPNDITQGSHILNPSERNSHLLQANNPIVLTGSKSLYSFYTFYVHAANNMGVLTSSKRAPLPRGIVAGLPGKISWDDQIRPFTESLEQHLQNRDRWEAVYKGKVTGAQRSTLVAKLTLSKPHTLMLELWTLTVFPMMADYGNELKLQYWQNWSVP